MLIDFRSHSQLHIKVKTPLQHYLTALILEARQRLRLLNENFATILKNFN